MQCDIQAKKGWGPICAYITKEDKNPHIWGNTSKAHVMEVAEAYEGKKKKGGAPMSATDIIEQLAGQNSWPEVFRHEQLKHIVLQRYPSMKGSYEDIQVLKLMEAGTLIERKVYGRKRMFQLL